MILKKENGIVTEITEKELPTGKDVVHLCGNCQNACPTLCEKVAQRFVNSTTTEKELNIYRFKQPIGEYPYINGGYQEINEKGHVTKFIVNDCDNHKKIEDSRRLTRKEIEERNKSLEYLLLYYTDTGSVEEANERLEEQFAKGLLIHKRRK